LTIKLVQQQKLSNKIRLLISNLQFVFLTISF
jgi:hypothetical protein